MGNGNVAFSLDQLSNLVKQNEYVVKGLSTWFYNDDDYLVFTNKNSKTIDGLLEYDEIADDKLLFTDDVDPVNTDTVVSWKTITTLVTTSNVIDSDESYRSEYKITLDSITDYNNFNEYDVVELIDELETSTELLTDFIIKEKLGNKTIVIYSDNFTKQSNSDVVISNLTKIRKTTRNTLLLNSKIVSNIVGDYDLSYGDIVVIDGNRYKVNDYFNNSENAIIILTNYYEYTTLTTITVSMYFGDNGILSPKLIYKDLIHFPTLSIFSKFKNNNKPLLIYGTNGELILDNDSMIDTKINQYKNDDFKAFIKYPVTIFDKNGYTTKYSDLIDGYYRVYVRVNVKSSVNNLNFDLNVVLAPQSENWETKKYTQIGGIYISGNVIQSKWDINDKPKNFTFDDIDKIIEQYDTYPVKENDIWYFKIDASDIENVDVKYSSTLETYQTPEYNISKLLIGNADNDISKIFHGIEYIDGIKYVSLVSNQYKPTIHRYKQDSLFSVGAFSLVCLL